MIPRMIRILRKKNPCFEGWNNPQKDMKRENNRGRGKYNYELYELVVPLLRGKKRPK